MCIRDSNNAIEPAAENLYASDNIPSGVSIESASYIENNNLDENNKISEIDGNNESEYTPKLFSEESYQTDEVMETKERENLSSDELFNQDSNEDEDFEIPAFLRKQKF